MSNYELTYILRPLEEANLTATNERINTLVKNAGGEIVTRNDWGRRRLAYPIQKLNDGYYSTLYVTLPGASVRGLERSLQLNDDVLRYLVVRVDEFKMPAAPTAEAPAQPTTETPAEPVVETTAAQTNTETMASPPAALETTSAPDTAPAITAEGS